MQSQTRPSVKRYFLSLLKPQWWRFEWRYWRKQTPWNTGITPPEVFDFIARTAPGRALDLGCGTGTNALTLAQHGWRVMGIDFSLKAIGAARKKAAAQRLPIDFFVHDVADIGFLRGPFDLVLDIGCLFSLRTEARQRYACGLADLTMPSARYMLYAWLPRQKGGRSMGMERETVVELFSPHFAVDQIEIGKDGGGPSAWYWFTRQ